MGHNVVPFIFWPREPYPSQIQLQLVIISLMGHFLILPVHNHVTLHVLYFRQTGGQAWFQIDRTGVDLSFKFIAGPFVGALGPVP